MDFRKFYLPATLVWVAGLFAGSVLPGRSLLATEIERFNLFGFGLHFLGYLIFGLLLVLTLKNYGIKNSFAYSVLIAAAFGLAMEGLQMFVPNRDPSVIDALANTVGAFISAGIYEFYHGHKGTSQA
ncbi:MAG: VanZ family protein [DPANN group archaeon]|nr:VanZ family protein [DPANN group archaeon]